MSELLTVIIVDDEPIAQDIIETFVGMVPYLKLLKKCDNAINALHEIQELKPDLIFLDIQMPKMTGLEMLKVIRNNMSQVILTTAHPDFAIEGFNLDVIDYLLKPISFERFFKAVNKASELLRLNRLGEKEMTRPEEVKAPPASVKNSMWIKQDKKLVHVCLEDIILVKAMKDYMQVFLPDKRVIAHITMGRLEEILCPPDFLRVNRSCIVRKTAIKAINGNIIETNTDEEIIMGITYRDSIREEIKELF
jgi:two-component system LytT family response regulator